MRLETQAFAREKSPKTVGKLSGEGTMASPGEGSAFAG